MYLVLCHLYINAVCVTRRPYNLYCVGGDVKPCSINQSSVRDIQMEFILTIISLVFFMHPCGLIQKFY